MARGLWKGAISFGLVNVPVELLSAEKRSSELDLTMLDRRDLAPVGYKRYNKSTGEEVPWAEIVKGYEYEDGRYVVLSEEDFRRANVEASRTVEILAFVELGDISPIYFQTPYYLAPGKQLGLPGSALRGPKVTSKEIDMALRLVEDMSEEWKPEQYEDTYREDLLARIREKIRKGQTEEITEPEKGAKEPAAGGEVIDLMALLKKSVERKQDKPKRTHKAKRRAA